MCYNMANESANIGQNKRAKTIDNKKERDDMRSFPKSLKYKTQKKCRSDRKDCQHYIIQKNNLQRSNRSIKTKKP